MVQHFLDADYPPNIVQEGLVKLQTLLKPSTDAADENEQNDKIFLITTYNPSGKILGDIVKDN